MDCKLLTAAAIAAAVTLSGAPAAAQHRGAVEGSVHHRSAGDHRFHRGPNPGVVGEWGSYDLRSSYDDRDWAADSGNDWWNDRPDRAFPRWVQEQRARGTCDPDRIWWSGSGWHC